MLFLCYSWSWHLLHFVDGCFSKAFPQNTVTPQATTEEEPVVSSSSTENCTGDYVSWYCLNGGICFRTKALDVFVLSCQCQPGWYGKRCEYKDIRDRYLPVQQQVHVAGLSVAVALLIVSVAFICLVLYVCYCRRRRRRHCLESGGANLSTGSATAGYDRTTNGLLAQKCVSQSI